MKTVAVNQSISLISQSQESHISFFPDEANRALSDRVDPKVNEYVNSEEENGRN